MVLDELEANSAVWLKIRAHLEGRLAIAHRRNAKSMSIERTEKLRGRIAELEYLVALGKPAPQTEADDFE